MKYPCLAYEEEAKLNALSRAEWAALREETLDYVERLVSRGQLIVTEPLQSPAAAVTVRVRHGRLAATDGAFAETKEQLGGIFLIEAVDLNEAVQIAAEWPTARFGSIEVRPVEPELRSGGRYATLRG